MQARKSRLLSQNIWHDGAGFIGRKEVLLRDWKMKQELIDLVHDVIQEMRESGALEVDGEIANTTPLYGETGILDSMGLVSVILTLEQEIEMRFDVQVALADEKALSQKRSPYRTIESIVEYALAEMGDEGA